MRMRLLAAIPLGILLVSALAPAADAGDLVTIDVRKQGKEYKEDINLQLQSGQKKNLDLKVKLNGVDSMMELQSIPSPTGFKYKYFSPGGNNITDAVTGTGHGFNLDTGEKKVFGLLVKSTGGAAACRLIETSGFEVGSSDGVFVRVNNGLCSL